MPGIGTGMSAPLASNTRARPARPRARARARLVLGVSGLQAATFHGAGVMESSFPNSDSFRSASVGVAPHARSAAGGTCRQAILLTAWDS